MTVDDCSGLKGSIRVTVDIPLALLCKLDQLKTAMGCRSRGTVVIQLLEELLSDESRFKKTNP